MTKEKAPLYESVEIRRISSKVEIIAGTSVLVGGIIASAALKDDNAKLICGMACEGFGTGLIIYGIWGYEAVISTLKNVFNGSKRLANILYGKPTR